MKKHMSDWVKRTSTKETGEIVREMREVSKELDSRPGDRKRLERLYSLYFELGRAHLKANTPEERGIDHKAKLRMERELLHTNGIQPEIADVASSLKYRYGYATEEAVSKARQLINNLILLGKVKATTGRLTADDEMLIMNISDDLLKNKDSEYKKLLNPLKFKRNKN